MQNVAMQLKLQLNNKKFAPRTLFLCFNCRLWINTAQLEHSVIYWNQHSSKRVEVIKIHDKDKAYQF